MKKRIRYKLSKKAIDLSKKSGYQIPKFRSWYDYRNFVDKCLIKIVGVLMLLPLKKPLDYEGSARKFFIIEEIK